MAGECSTQRAINLKEASDDDDDVAREDGLVWDVEEEYVE